MIVAFIVALLMNTIRSTYCIQQTLFVCSARGIRNNYDTGVHGGGGEVAVIPPPSCEISNSITCIIILYLSYFKKYFDKQMCMLD